MPVIFTQEWLGLSPDLLNILALVLSAIVVLVVLWLIISAIRRPRFASSRRSRQARLAITDAALIDERRKLVLVRRDNVEHLVLIGGANDLVIESDIGAQPQAVATPHQEPAVPSAPMAAAVPPRPAANTAEPKTAQPKAAQPNAAQPTPAPTPRAEPAPIAKPAVPTPAPAAPTPSVTPPASAAPAVSTGGPKVVVSHPQVTRSSEAPKPTATPVAEATPKPNPKPTMGDNMDALLNRISDDKQG
ncbi:MAG: hypothetical protein AAGK33_06705 [Pseudomonadota bacterium]